MLDIDHARRLFDERLRSEGLAPIETDGLQWRGGDGGRRAEPGAAQAAEAYLTWASAVLDKPSNFRSRTGQHPAPVNRAAWKLHAEGRTNDEVAAALGVSRARVEKALRFVRVRAGFPPVMNPWRRSGRIRAETRGVTNMAKEETKPAGPVWTRFAVIQLRSGEEVNVPGGRPRQRFIDHEARYTPMGMDVRIPDKGYAPLTDADGKVTYSIRDRAIEGADLVVGIPAYKIAQAERVMEGSR